MLPRHRYLSAMLFSFLSWIKRQIPLYVPSKPPSHATSKCTQTHLSTHPHAATLVHLDYACIHMVSSCGYDRVSLFLIHTSVAISLTDIIRTNLHHRRNHRLRARSLRQLGFNTDLLQGNLFRKRVLSHAGIEHVGHKTILIGLGISQPIILLANPSGCLLCSGSTLGRLIPGYLADRMGSFNVTLTMTTVTLLAILTIWLPVGDSSEVGLYVVSVCLGFGTGSFVSTSATCLGQLCDVRDMGKYLGSCYTVVSLSTLASTPVCQYILSHNGPAALIWFLAGVLASALASCLVVRWTLLGYRWVWLVKV